MSERKPGIFGGRESAQELRRRTGELSRLAGITEVRYGRGRAEDVRALELRNGAGLTAVLVADRALDALELNYRGVPLTWLGPGGLTSPRAYVPHIEEFERSFFGGLVTTCGLTAFGPPGSDRWGSWTQHGRVNLLPATIERAEVDWEAPEPAIRIAGMVREARMFGERLRLERSWTMPLGGTTLELHDRVVNEGGRSEPHMILYHCNAGYPLLDDDAVWTVTESSVTPRDEAAAKGLAEWNRGGPPHPEFHEQVFVHVPQADASGWASATVSNPLLCGGLSLQVAFRPDELPALFTWRMLGCGTYVMAAEPANCPTVQGRVQAEHDGTLPMLEPGEAREYRLTFRISERFFGKSQPSRA